MRRPAPTRAEFAAANPAGGRPPKHGSEFIFKDSRTWGAPDAETKAETTRYGTAHAQSWDRLHPELQQRAAWRDHPGKSSASRSTTCPAAATPSRCGCGGHDRQPARQRPILPGRPSFGDSTSSTSSG